MKPVFTKIENSAIAARERSRASLPTAVLFGGITVMLLMFGLTVLYSTSYGTAGTAFFVKQLMWAGTGTAGALGVLFFGFKKISDCRYRQFQQIILQKILLIFCR